MNYRLLIAAAFATSLPFFALAAADGARERGERNAAPRHHQHQHQHQHQYHGQHARGADRHWDKSLNLSREQRQQIDELRREEAKNRQQIIDKYWQRLPQAEKNALRDELAENAKKSGQAIRSKLNAEQQQAFDKMQEKREQQRAEREEFQKWKEERAAKAE